MPAVTVVTYAPPGGSAPVLLLDPTDTEERGAGAATTVALMPSSGLLAYVFAPQPRVLWLTHLSVAH
jgi:hypothetical protein